MAIVAFESEYDNLSDFIMEEITGALFERGIEVADWQNLPYVYQELDFQMSGDVSDETVQSIGRFLGAEVVITGQFISMGGAYRYRANAIRVETAARESVTRLTVQDNRELRRMINTIANQSTVVRRARYGVSEDREPQTAGTYLDRGIMFASRSEYDKAIADFTEALRLNPDMASAYELRGRALVASVSKVFSVGDNFSAILTMVTSDNATAEQGRVLDRAIADFTQAIRLDPQNPMNYRERGRAYSDKGETDKGLADYDEAIRLDPNDASGYNDRGTVYAEKGEYDQAIADYTQAIRLDPNHALAYNNRGSAYGSKGNYDEAIADYTQAIRLDPDSALAYNNRGYAYSNKGAYDQAIADYEEALRIDPNYDMARQNLEDARQQWR